MHSISRFDMLAYHPKYCEYLLLLRIEYLIKTCSCWHGLSETSSLQSRGYDVSAVLSYYCINLCCLIKI